LTAWRPPVKEGSEVFLLTFVTSIAGVILYGPVLDQEDYILNGSADGRIALGALLEIGLVITNIGTAVVLYPIARRYTPTLAPAGSPHASWNRPSSPSARSPCCQS
jgi:hypothetical protein